MQNLKLFITGHKGFETPLLHELRAILESTGAVLRKAYGGVEVEATIVAAYRVCLHSRLANRVFCELGQAPADGENALYQAVYRVEWERHLLPRNSIAVSATVSRSKIGHSQFVALKTKDAVVDRMREVCGSRPPVEKHRPDLRLHVHLHQNRAKISLDLSGESLHRRGYRQQHAGAPLKEHLAAALLWQAGWRPGQAAYARLLDPMCGAGTFAIEAAMIAAEIAPGLGREYFGFRRWLGHDEALWQQCLRQAEQARKPPGAGIVFASDRDADALAIARANAGRAGVERWIEFSCKPVDQLQLPAAAGETLVICNPPYGRRLGSEAGLDRLYRELGTAVRRHDPARLAILSANPELLHELRLRRVDRKNLRNGPLDCLFAQFETAAVERATPAPPMSSAPPSGDAAAALPLRNRLLKNARHLERWAKRNDVTCYRLYDADLPEFAFALDRYQGEIDAAEVWYSLQEYRAPASVDPALAAQRIELAADVVRELFEVAPGRLYCKIRSRQRGAAQYRKHDSQGEFFQVREGAASLLVNPSDYLDSGLFLDHRPTRERVYRQARGKRLLNLFCYTGAVGVQAALGGARSVLNVDLSPTYLDWARKNFRLNGLDDEERYAFLRADIVELLKNPAGFAIKPGYDLIFFDPPSFSNSKKMRQTLDIQRDHAAMIRQAMALLAADGTMLFSTNRRDFRLEADLVDEFEITDISRATLPEDFRRNPKIHRCWEIRHVPA